jgi:hypothetical protein
VISMWSPTSPDFDASGLGDAKNDCTRLVCPSHHTSDPPFIFPREEQSHGVSIKACLSYGGRRNVSSCLQ